MADKFSLDVNRTWHDIPETGKRVWDPENARGVIALVVGASNWNPADNTGYYFGNLFAINPKADASWYSAIFLPCDMLITRVDINWYADGTAGSNEEIAMYIRHSAGSNLVATVSDTNANKLFSNSNLNISLVAGDKVEITLVTPSWATNPTDVTVGGNIFGWSA